MPDFRLVGPVSLSCLFDLTYDLENFEFLWLETEYEDVESIPQKDAWKD